MGTTKGTFYRKLMYWCTKSMSTVNTGSGSPENVLQLGQLAQTFLGGQGNLN